MKQTERMENIAIDKLIPYINNSRTHSKDQINKIQSSLREFGFVNPVLIDKDFGIISGHGRVAAAKLEGIENVPCVFVDHLTDAQKKAYIIADNRLALDAGWDMEILKIELEELGNFNFDLSLTGFDTKEIDLIFEEPIEIKEDDFDVDKAFEEIDEPITKRGDIYQLGNHRLMCGDSTTTAEVSVLMDGKKAHACWTDPPYNINYGNIKHPKFKQREIQNDNMSKEDFKEFCIEFIKRIKENVLGCVYMAGAQGPDGRIMFTIADELMHCSTTIIWNKDQFTLGRGKYHNKYEPIWFGWVDDGTRFTDNRKLTNVWEIARPKKSDLHPTMKPVELVITALEHSTLRTDVVLDLFGGSGTTVIACEQLDRICYMMELDEKYCDVIIKRWETLTGNKAVLING